MSKTENANSSCAASGQAKCAPIGLLLFVGFIFGFSVGFGTHDVIYTNLSSAMSGGKTIMSEPINKEHTGGGKGHTMTEGTDESQTEEKEKKPEDKPEEQKAE